MEIIETEPGQRWDWKCDECGQSSNRVIRVAGDDETSPVDLCPACIAKAAAMLLPTPIHVGNL